MLNPILAGLTSFVISFAFLPFLIRFSKEKMLVSHPGKRRIHKKITPSLGGIAIFLGFTISCICWGTQPKSLVIFFLLPILIIPFVTGLLDDLIHLKPTAKLFGQWATVSLLFFILDTRLSSDYGILGGRELPLAFSYVVTVLTVVLIINALNLIDGIDGLAATFSLVAGVFFGGWFYFTGNLHFAIICLSLVGAILAFLFMNWEPSIIFMGDTGSLVIGTILSVVVMQFMNANFALEATHPLKFESSVGAAIAVMIIPLADTTRIIIIRLYKGISLFTADKRHIHHALVRLGLSHGHTVYVLTTVHVSVISIAVLLKNTAQWVLFGALTVTVGCLSLILQHFLSAAVKKVSSQDATEQM